MVDAGDSLRARRLSVLRSLDLFRELPRERLEHLAEALVPLVFAAGAVIVREGQAGDYLYVVVDGEVELSRAGREGAAVRGPGECFGELAVLQGMPQEVSVVARMTTSIYAVEAGELAAVAETLRRTQAR